jgi:plasmid stabilization system protein ParE
MDNYIVETIVRSTVQADSPEAARAIAIEIAAVLAALVGEDPAILAFEVTLGSNPTKETTE